MKMKIIDWGKRLEMEEKLERINEKYEFTPEQRYEFTLKLFLITQGVEFLAEKLAEERRSEDAFTICPNCSYDLLEDKILKEIFSKYNVPSLDEIAEGIKESKSIEDYEILQECSRQGFINLNTILKYINL